MKKDGEGRENFPDGKILEGEYFDDFLHGYGKGF